MLRARSGNEELALAGPLSAAIMSFSRGDYKGAVESISAIRAAADRCGGSVAQCDLIHLTLLEAALRGQQKRLARTLADEREPPQSLAQSTRVDSGDPCAGDVSAARRKLRRPRGAPFNRDAPTDPRITNCVTRLTALKRIEGSRHRTAFGRSPALT